MKEMKRILSLVLCFVMLVGLLPNLAFLARAEETPVDALVIFSDLHAMYNGDSSTGDKGYKQTKITNMMTALKNTGLPFSSVHSGGDAFSSNSTQNTNYTDTVTGYIQNVLGNIPVGYVWSDHDRGALDNDSSKKKLDKTSHLAYGAGNDGEYGTADDGNYYVYYLSMGDLCSYDRYGAGFNYTQTDNSGRVSAGFTPTVAEAIANFQADAAKLDKSKPLFIVSHQPLFDNRNDNAWAEDWFDAINAVAEKMDVAFFYGHNHKYDNASDYYYAKGSKMPVATADNWNWQYETKAGYLGYLPSMDLTSESKTLNFTHMCGGYFDPNTTGSTSSTTREGTMVAVEIYADHIQYTTYNNAGKYTGNYALNESVKRDHASTGTVTPGTTVPSEPETSEPAETEPVTPESETVYVLVDAPVNGEKYLISNVSLANKDSLSSDWGTGSSRPQTEEEGVLLIKNGTGVPTYEFVTVNTGSNGATDGIFLNADAITVGDVTYSDGYITMLTENAAAIWTAAYENGSWKFSNNGDYLLRNGDDPATDKTGSLWTYADSYLKNDTNYLYFSYDNSGTDAWHWTTKTTSATGASTRDIYFYQEVVIEAEEEPEEPSEPTDPSEPETPVVEKVDEATGIKVSAPGLTALEVAAVTEGAAFEAAAQILEAGFVAYDIDVEGFENGSGTATVTIPCAVEDAVVYYISDDGTERAPMDIISVADGYVTFETDHFTTYAVGRAIVSGEWVEITEPIPGEITKYGYTLATSLSSGDYVIVASDDDRVLTKTSSNGFGSQTSGFTISGNTITSDTELTLWTFTVNNNRGSIKNGSHYFAYSSNSFSLTNRSNSAANLAFSYNANGQNFRIRGSNNGGSFYWSGTSWTSNTSPRYVRLFVRDTSKDVTADPVNGLYGKIVGENVFNVPRHTSSEAALAIVKAGVEVRYAYASATPDASDEGEFYGDEDSGMIWTMDPNYNGGVAGSYTVTVQYNTGSKVVTLGTVTVVVPEFEFKPENANLSDTVGSVSKGAASDAEVGVTLTITDNEGVEHNVNVTLDMLTDANGNPVSTANKATFENLTLTYNGVEITENFTLNVVGRAGNNYPEHPEEGAVKVSKTGTGIDFQSTGLAQIEIAASGVPMKAGIDVIVMLDTSSSMTRCIHCGDKHSSSPNACANGYKSRLAELNEALDDMIMTFGEKNPDGTFKHDIRIAIRDFNGTVGGATAWDSGDRTQDASGIGTGATLNTFTGTGLGKDAFVDLAEHYDELLDINVTKYQSGTNYDYAFDAIYQMGQAIQEANGENKRELFVIFMSDGSPNYYNYYGSQGGNTATSGSDDWNYWLTGAIGKSVTVVNSDGTSRTFDGTKRTMAETVNTANHYHYFHEETGNQHRMANAVKGDPNKPYEIIRKATGLTGMESTGESNMYTIPGLGATMYSVAFTPANDGRIQKESMIHVLRNIATSVENHYFEAEDSGALSGAFKNIATDILYAANNARFVDQMGDNYNLKLGALKDLDGNPVTVDGKEVQNKIEILEYVIYTKAEADKIPEGTANDDVTEEMIGQRKLDESGKPIVSKVLETVTFNSDGTEAYSDQIGGGTENILRDDGVIYAKYFWYNTNSTTAVPVEGVRIPTGINADNTTTDKQENGWTNMLPDETFYWNMGQVKTTELAMRYFVYLEDSMEGKKDAGSYPTNNFATLYYDNYLGNPCYKDTVSPILAWKSANVSYAFYLVDDQGRPVVNQTTGDTGSFANRIAVTNPVIYHEIMLNSGIGLKAVEAASADVLPNYYTLYDPAAKYDVNVDSDGTGDWTITVGTGKNPTTYVTGHDRNDASAASREQVTTGETTGYDYTHTTVWFAVQYKIEAHPDTVVIDYGLPVDISVLVNDMFGDNGKLAAIGPAPENAEELQALLDKRGGNEGLASNFGNGYTGTYGSATMDAATGKVRYTLNTSNGMQMQTYEQFMYAVNYTGAEKPGYYYDTVTVIPATTIYYEDNFLTYESLTWSLTENKWVTKTDGSVWSQEATVEGVQGEDRPGKYSLNDANNIYGYDSVNKEMTTHSLNNARKATVDYDNMGTANFTFWGTGFDLISMTSADTGTIYVYVERIDGGGTYSNKFPVDTYYGYTGVLHNVTYTYTDGEWVRTVGEAAAPKADGTDPEKVPAQFPNPANEGDVVNAIENVWVLNPTSKDCIWQVPVIKLCNLPYGKYQVRIEAFYTPAIDHKDPSYSGSYDFYLDAIRIYDPANDGAAADSDTVIEDAYKQDHEGWPSYFELRNGLIAANTFGDQEITNAPDKPLIGLVFIDGDPKVGNADIEDYISFGPNNEVYLAPGQRVAFLLSDVQINGASIVDQIHIGIKSADGKAGTYTITNIAKDDSKEGFAAGTFYGPRTYNINTSTDMYYDLTAWKGDIIVISNTGAEGSGIISLTNIKATYTESPANAVSVVVPQQNDNGNTQDPESSDDQLSTASVDNLDVPTNEVYAYMTPQAATLTLRALNAPAVQEPEETEPEVPETTEPQETEPETTAPETTVPETSEPETTVPETTVPEETKPATGNAELKSAVEAAKKLKEKDYTKESFKAVKDALKKAEKVLKDKKASQVKIDAALEALNAAVEALEAKPDTSALKKAVDEAKKLKEKDYTKESFKEFKKVLKDVEKVLKDKNATQAEIDAALEELNEAVEALEAKAPKGKPGKK